MVAQPHVDQPGQTYKKLVAARVRVAPAPHPGRNIRHDEAAARRKRQPREIERHEIAARVADCVKVQEPRFSIEIGGELRKIRGRLSSEIGIEVRCKVRARCHGPSH